MIFRNLGEQLPAYQSNLRAEDGARQNSQRNGLYESLLLPLGVIFLIFMILLFMSLRI
jgi:hypothetical protein